MVSKRRIAEFTEIDATMSQIAGRPVICVPVDEVRLGGFTRPLTRVMDSPNVCLRATADVMGDQFDACVKPVQTEKRRGWQGFARTVIESRLLNVAGRGTVRTVYKRRYGKGRLFFV